MAYRLQASALKTCLACPCCHGALDWSPDMITCTACGAPFAIVDGIPVMVPVDERPGSSEADRLHKRQQAAFFDNFGEAEFEIRRPWGTARLYRWMMEHKFKRSLASLGGIDLNTAIAVCGGSGMDAELLARRGMSVIVSDISLGAARRAQERARRSGLPIEVVVADVEQLPFAGSSVDLVYVHDGLHHLNHPLAGVQEMARVAARAVSINEPAKAALTAAAVTVGIATSVEDAGNRVERLNMDDLIEILEGDGLRVTRAQRYALFYRHEPGPVARLMSAPGLFQATTLGWAVVNLAIGRFGNKLTVQAKR